MLSAKTLPAEGSRPRPTVTGVLSETGRVSSAAKPRESQPFPPQLDGGSPPLDLCFLSTALLRAEGLLCLCPSQGENGHCLADPWGWTKTALSILPLLSSPSKDAGMWQASLLAADVQVWRAAAGQSKWAVCVCLSPFTHQAGHAPEPPSLSQSAAGCL